MNLIKGSSQTCGRCGNALKDHTCRKCDLVYCPFCWSQEGECEHLIADWESGYMVSAHFISKSPFLGDGVLPHLSVEFDSPLILLPINYETALGDMSPLLEAYNENVFEPPNPPDLFQSIAPLMSQDQCWPSRRSGPRSSHTFCFAADPTAARAEIQSILLALQKRLAQLGAELRNRLFDELAANPAESRGDLVYGEIDDYLVFIMTTDAEKLSDCHKAVWTSKTWGQLRSRVTRHDYNELLAPMDEAIGFFAFYRDWRVGKPRISRARAREAYMGLPIGERLPEDSDPFDVEQVPWVLEGHWPDWPAQAMLEWVPRNVREQYGTEECSTVNGEFLTFACNDERKVVAEFRRAGYRCVRDDELVQRASGYNV